MYSILANNAKPHFTDNYLLAQAVQKDMAHGNHGRKFESPEIIHNEDVGPKEYHWYTWYSVGEKVSVMAGEIEVFFHIGAWPQLKKDFAKSIKKNRDLQRPFVKLYGDDTILCMTESQANQFKWALFRNNDRFNELHQRHRASC